jgi:D-threo-aldose 1-dehydrogenase
MYSGRLSGHIQVHSVQADEMTGSIAVRHWKSTSGCEITFTQRGFGTATLGNLYSPITDDEAEATLQAAWDVGMRYFDTAPQYGLGNSERRLGRFLRTQPSGYGSLPFARALLFA